MNALNTPADGDSRDDSPTEQLGTTWTDSDSTGAASTTAASTSAASTSAASTGAASTRPDQPLYAPLPYGTGFSSPQPLGFGVGPTDLGFAAAGSASSAVAVTETKRAGSPVLAVAGLLSMGVAVWAILGAPVITPTVLLAAGLVLMVLVGLMMVVRR